MSVTPEESPTPLPPHGVILVTEITCESPAGSAPEYPAYSATYTSLEPPNPEDNQYFEPWSQPIIPGAPTSFTLIGTVKASELENGEPVDVDVTVTVSINGSGTAGGSPATPIDLSASASGVASATATLEVNLANYGATPDNSFSIIDAKTEATGKSSTGLTSAVTVALSIPESIG
jgi:hypothetical protein